MISKKAVERASGSLIVTGGASWLTPHIAPKDFGFVHQNEGAFQTGGEIALGLGVILAFGLYVKNYLNKGMVDITEDAETQMPFIVPSEPGEEAAGRRNDQRVVQRKRRQRDS